MNAIKERKHIICPRCGGNTYIEDDYHSPEEVCVQCGWRNDLILKPLPFVGNMHERKGNKNEERDQAIVKDREAKMQYPQLVEKYGLCQSTIKDIIQKYKLINQGEGK